MGQTLSSPATFKRSESGQNGKFFYSVTEMQGWRISMEDAHTVVLDLDDSSDNSNMFFAVYDGHGGESVAQFAGKNVHKRLTKEEDYQEKRYDKALKRAFLGTDEDLLADPAHKHDPSGCTAVAALVAGGKIYLANAGDSRSVLSVKGKAKPLSYDHKPTNDGERARITAAGGYVEWGRVNGNLALSRAIGDFDFKKNSNIPPEQQIITSDPDVEVHDITEEDEFFVIACDGIWDCLTSQQVINFIRYEVSQGKELSEIGEMICDHCLAPDISTGAGIGSDNMTILITAILHGRSKEEWYSWIADRVKNKYGFDTPASHPQLYAPSRVAAFRARQQMQRERDSNRSHDLDESPAASFLTASGLGGFARVLGSTGGISFSPNGGIVADNESLMFGSDDSDDEDEESEDLNGRPFFSPTLGLGHSSVDDDDGTDAAKSLKARLAEFEKDLQDEELEDDVDSDTSDTDLAAADLDDKIKVDGDAEDERPKSPSTRSTVHLQGEAPPPPSTTSTLPNGDTKTPVVPVEQLKSTPGGDKASPAVQADGLMDTSEDPIVTFA